MTGAMDLDLTYADVPGIEIREVPVLPGSLEGAARCGGWSMARPGALLQTVPGVARFLVREGRLIELAREANADPVAVEQFLAGSVRAAIVHQQGGLPLHAACLAPPEGEFAVAIAGHSGAGKSTLAAELVRRGWSLLGDDMTPLYYSEEGVMAWPSRGGLKLWRDACEAFAVDVADLRALPGERDKYLLPVESYTGPLRLADVFFLERGEPAGVFPVAGADRLATLSANTYKPHWINGMGCVQSHFQICIEVSNKVDLLVLRHGTVAERADSLTAYCKQQTVQKSTSPEKPHE